MKKYTDLVNEEKEKAANENQFYIVCYDQDLTDDSNKFRKEMIKLFIQNGDQVEETISKSTFIFSTIKDVDLEYWTELILTNFTGLYRQIYTQREIEEKFHFVVGSLNKLPNNTPARDGNLDEALVNNFQKLVNEVKDDIKKGK
jgi:histidinol phosphatase-like enzyme